MVECGVCRRRMRQTKKKKGYCFGLYVPSKSRFYIGFSNDLKAEKACT